LRWHKHDVASEGQSGSSTGTGNNTMSDAQVGLLVATPIIVIFALALYRMGVLRLSGAIAAVAMSVAIGAVLFFTQ
jgi:hypothetical protein